MKDLISSILKRDPLKRIGLEEICNHKWMIENLRKGDGWKNMNEIKKLLVE